MSTMRATVAINAETDDLRKQQMAFCILTLCVLAMLLLLHTLFASVLAEPSIPVIVLLGLSFSLKLVELLWLLSRRQGLTERSAKLESALSIVFLFSLSALLAYLTNRDDSPYFVLLAIPILQCAYLFGLLPTVLTIVLADGMIMFWLWHYFGLYPPAKGTEYLEGSMISLIYALMGSLVWFLVNQLKANQAKLSANLIDLRATRERLIREEKLAAVGRLASGIAHEIRNPVAMISSSLTTAAETGLGEVEREEMFSIAARQARRLEALTADFLTYARPSVPQRSLVLVNDLLSYIADVTKMHAARRDLEVRTDLTPEMPVEVDASQLEGALLNLALNSIDATPEGGTIELRASRNGDMLCIEVQNSGTAIPDSDLARIFEPFFTTKPNGTGLGLAIARGVARAHDGELWVSSNQDGRVTFSMTLTTPSIESTRKEAIHG
jgi:two-component system, NtrC family, sensor histidine kinase HydH